MSCRARSPLVATKCRDFGASCRRWITGAGRGEGRSGTGSRRRHETRSGTTPGRRGGFSLLRRFSGPRCIASQQGSAYLQDVLCCAVLDGDVLRRRKRKGSIASARRHIYEEMYKLFVTLRLQYSRTRLSSTWSWLTHAPMVTRICSTHGLQGRRNLAEKLTDRISKLRGASPPLLRRHTMLGLCYSCEARQLTRLDRGISFLSSYSP